MSYKYFYRIQYERAIGNNEWATGSITEQFRNSPLTSREFKNIRWHIFNEMDVFDVTEVRACIYRISSADDYRISSADDYRIGEFDGTENMENQDLDRICGCYIPLVGIVHVTKYSFATHRAWYDCGTPRRSLFHGHTAYKKS